MRTQLFCRSFCIYSDLCKNTQANPGKQFAKMADVFLGSILTSSNHGAPFPVGFSEENTVFTLGGIGGI